MTLPTTTTLSDHCDDDSDMFGPPRSTPPMGYHHHRSRVPMISPKLRQREERKRILQLCAHKLERIKDSETNLRRSVCINNTYCRLTDELRREKQSRYLANLPKSDTKPETARDNIFNPYNSCGIDSSNHQPSTKLQQQDIASRIIYSSENQPSNGDNQQLKATATGTTHNHHMNNNSHTTYNLADNNQQNHTHHHQHSNNSTTPGHTTHNNSNNNSTSPTPSATSTQTTVQRKRQQSSNNLDTDLEILDRELSAINAPMPLIDPEITQGAEQLEKAISSRKRLRSEDESDRLVREALSQFYIPPQRLISAIEDCPLDAAAVAVAAATNSHHHNHLHHSQHHHSHHHHHHHHKRSKLDLDLDFDMNQNQKEFEVIMDALRLGTPSPTPSVGSDSCGQAAMMSESGVFHNLVVTSLET